MTISIAQTFTTPDGKTFTSRKLANEHQAFVARAAKVQAVLDADTNADGAKVADVVARNAEAIVKALNNPLERGRKAPAAA